MVNVMVTFSTIIDNSPIKVIIQSRELVYNHIYNVFNQTIFEYDSLHCVSRSFETLIRRMITRSSYIVQQ